MERSATPLAPWLRAAGILLAASALWACGGGGSTPADGSADAVVDGGLDSGDTSTLCGADAECDDGLFCDGVERCAPGDSMADARGCVPAVGDACMAGQTCDEAADRCQTMCDLAGDADGDGHDALDCGGDDCDDADAERYPGNAEVCDADGHDEDCDPTTLGADGDADGDGHLRVACCNPQADGSSLCGDDCDDTNMDVHPGALEVCDGDVDNDCNGLADAADGVCVPCPSGFRGVDDNCTNIDECAEMAPCGSATGITCTDTNGSYTCNCPAGYTGAGVGAGGTCVDDDECTLGAPCGAMATACDNLPGTYSCTCASGYAAPATGGSCRDVDECLDSTTCGSQRAGCTNTLGSYICSCNSGYEAPPSGGSCGSIDQCGTGTPCGVHGTSCTNTPGSYQCTCQAGYTAPSLGGTCVDIDECATASTCGSARAGCTNAPGSYSCSCASGYTAPATGGTCVDIDECATSVDDCDTDPAALCRNTAGSFACACPMGPWTGTGSGPAGCTLTNPQLSGLVPSVGAFDAAFAPATTAYTLTLPPATSAFRLTPSVDYPSHATIRVGGTTVASGAASMPISMGSALVTQVVVTVTTDHGETASYTVTAVRASAYVKASNTGAADGFRAVAISADGRTMAIGAEGEASGATGIDGNQSDDSAPGAGAVYIFGRTGAVWSQRAYVKASNTEAGDRFGFAVALSADGTTLAVAALGEDSGASGVGGNQADNTKRDSGAAYVFRLGAGGWSQQAYVKASNPDIIDSFGQAVALSSDGNTLAVGAFRERSNARGIGGNQADNSASDAGAAYVFTRSGSTWSQQAYIKASNADAGDWFGYALSLSADGGTLAVGAPHERSSATGVGGGQTSNAAPGAGAVYVFGRIGAVWSQTAYLKASNTDSGDHFGIAVALSGNGSTLAVGADTEDSSATGVGGDQTDGGAVDAGAAYVFALAGAVWSQQAYLKASNTDASDRFGSSLTLSDNGDALLVGALYEASVAVGVGGMEADNSDYSAGAAYLFSRTGVAWSQAAYVKASNTGGSDAFGDRVAMSGDGSVLAIGARREDSNATGVGGDQANNSASDAGAVYVF